MTEILTQAWCLLEQQTTLVRTVFHSTISRGQLQCSAGLPSIRRSALHFRAWQPPQQDSVVCAEGEPPSSSLFCSGRRRLFFLHLGWNTSYSAPTLCTGHLVCFERPVPSHACCNHDAQSCPTPCVPNGLLDGFVASTRAGQGLGRC